MPPRRCRRTVVEDGGARRCRHTTSDPSGDCGRHPAAPDTHTALDDTSVTTTNVVADTPPWPTPTAGADPHPNRAMVRGTLERRGLPPDIADDYPPELLPAEIERLHHAGVTGDDLERWPRDQYTTGEVAALHLAGHTPDTADAWPDTFEPLHVAVLTATGHTPDTYQRWRDTTGGRFDPVDVAELTDAGVPAEEAAEWPSWLTAPQIVALWRRGVRGPEARRWFSEPLPASDFESLVGLIDQAASQQDVPQT